MQKVIYNVGHNWEISELLQTTTTPKIRFPACPAYQNMAFSYISYTFLAEDRVEFYENE